MVHQEHGQNGQQQQQKQNLSAGLFLLSPRSTHCLLVISNQEIRGRDPKHCLSVWKSGFSHRATQQSLANAPPNKRQSLQFTHGEHW